jgi:hypothetical protein
MNKLCFASQQHFTHQVDLLYLPPLLKRYGN